MVKKYVALGPYTRLPISVSYSNYDSIWY